MQATAVFESDSLAVFDYRCTAGPASKPYVEVRETHSLSYVRSGSFGCRTLGEEHELVAGAVLVVQPGREYMATHEHHGCGDECLSFRLSRRSWQTVLIRGKSSSAWLASRRFPS